VKSFLEICASLEDNPIAHQLFMESNIWMMNIVDYALELEATKSAYAFKKMWGRHFYMIKTEKALYTPPLLDLTRYGTIERDPGPIQFFYVPP
jgi:hypothetical protein